MTAADIARLFARADWMTDAACKGMGPDIFYPEHGQWTKAAAAREVCQRCPVKTECGQHALDTDERHGIWGGGSIDRRRRGHTDRPRTSKGSGPQRQPINHGTLGGYRAHIRHDVPLCDDCKAARATYRRQMRAEGMVA